MADDLRGKGKHVQGKIQEGLGDLLGDRKLKRKGKLAQTEGRAEQDEERALEEAREARARKHGARLGRELED
jgi:uncharacterized protein YjbJ (UPF0337 family)